MNMIQPHRRNPIRRRAAPKKFENEKFVPDHEFSKFPPNLDNTSSPNIKIPKIIPSKFLNSNK